MHGVAYIIRTNISQPKLKYMIFDYYKYFIMKNNISINPKIIFLYLKTLSFVQ
jgi:hypothetical protein